MLIDSESEQVREVYAHYGLAMSWAQGLEPPQQSFHHGFLRAGLLSLRVDRL